MKMRIKKSHFRRKMEDRFLRFSSPILASMRQTTVRKRAMDVLALSNLKSKTYALRLPLHQSKKFKISNWAIKRHRVRRGQQGRSLSILTLAAKLIAMTISQSASTATADRWAKKSSPTVMMESSSGTAKITTSWCAVRRFLRPNNRKTSCLEGPSHAAILSSIACSWS